MLKNVHESVDEIKWIGSLVEVTSELMALTNRVMLGEADPASEKENLVYLVKNLGSLSEQVGSLFPPEK